MDGAAVMGTGMRATLISAGSLLKQQMVETCYLVAAYVMVTAALYYYRHQFEDLPLLVYGSVTLMSALVSIVVVVVSVVVVVVVAYSSLSPYLLPPHLHLPCL